MRSFIVSALRSASVRWLFFLWKPFYTGLACCMKELFILGRMFRISSDGELYAEPFVSACGKRHKGRWVKRYCSKVGYSSVMLYGPEGSRHFYVHRLVAMAFLENYRDGLDVDHINGMKADNRVANLRMATRSENFRGFRRKNINTSSRYRGVHFDSWTGKWRSCIKLNGRKTYGPRRETEVEAGMDYNAMAKELGFRESAFNEIT